MGMTTTRTLSLDTPDMLDLWIEDEDVLLAHLNTEEPDEDERLDMV